MGTVVGRKYASAPNNPCRVKRIPSPIPLKGWHLTPLAISVAGGLLPFGSIFIEMYFIFTSFWNYKVRGGGMCAGCGCCGLRFGGSFGFVWGAAHLGVGRWRLEPCASTPQPPNPTPTQPNPQVYYVYGFMLLVFIILMIVTGCVTIVGTYFLLNAENYHWQWTAFTMSGSTAGYVFLYAVRSACGALGWFGLFAWVGAVCWLGLDCLGLGTWVVREGSG